tara:strand:+ start:136 stop:423 length:288 start_codon:yes stop_codon:yes gene_type:complete
MEATKFTEDELSSLRKLQQDYLSTQNQFGQVVITELNLRSQMDELEKIKIETEENFIKLQETEKELVDELTDKYGQGTLDPKSGVFTPTETADKK